MARIRLTQARIEALRPRNTVRDIRDAGPRVSASVPIRTGRACFIHSRHGEKRVWKTVGDAASPSVADARARSMPAASRNGTSAASETILFEEVFRRYGRNWKPRTLRVNRGWFANQILPGIFKALKLGTRIEGRRLDQADDLRKCLAFDAVTACRVMTIERLARSQPEAPARPPDEITVLNIDKTSSANSVRLPTANRPSKPSPSTPHAWQASSPESVNPCREPGNYGRATGSSSLSSKTTE